MRSRLPSLVKFSYEHTKVWQLKLTNTFALVLLFINSIVLGAKFKSFNMQIFKWNHFKCQQNVLLKLTLIFYIFTNIVLGTLINTSFLWSLQKKDGWKAKQLPWSSMVCCVLTMSGKVTFSMLLRFLTKNVDIWLLTGKVTFPQIFSVFASSYHRPSNWLYMASLQDWTLKEEKIVDMYAMFSLK